MFDRFAAPLAIALGAAWAVLVFLWGPLLSRVRPEALAWSGLVFSFAVAWAILAYKLKWPEVGTYPATIGLGFAAAALQPGISEAVEADKANSLRCEAVQEDMLSAMPRRADGPDLFQALGCRPQGKESVYARPTKLERVAGHALPEGGRR